MLNPRIVFILALSMSMFVMSCSSAPAAPAPTTASVATSAAPAASATNAPATSAPAANANTPGAFSKTDPQLAPAGIKGDAANGAKLFTAKKIECDGCHDGTKSFPGGDFGPNQANVSVVAQSILKSADYKGKAKTVEEYIRESILAPNIFIVPGDDYHEKDGTSAMKQDFAQTLTPQQVEDLVAYLLSLKPQ